MTTLQEIIIHFPTKDNKEAWVMRYCNSVKGCRRCPIWGMKTALGRRMEEDELKEDAEQMLPESDSF